MRYTDNEAELFDVVRQIGQSKCDLVAFFQIIKLEGMKVAQQDVAREVAVPQPGKIVQRLRLGLFEVSASALLLNEKDALPEKVNETALVAKVLDRLLEARDAAHRDAENIEKSR